MARLPDRHQQIITVHAAFIREVVELSQKPGHRDDLEGVLQAAVDNGWAELVTALRTILSGKRDRSVLLGLDEEDTVIAEAILRGLQNPAELPPVKAKADPSMAAPGLAGIIREAATGNVEALRAVSNMAEQMRRAGGQMARLASVVRPLINGERDPDKLCRGMSTQTEQLILGILEELGKIERH